MVVGWVKEGLRFVIVGVEDGEGGCGFVSREVLVVVEEEKGLSDLRGLLVERSGSEEENSSRNLANSSSACSSRERGLLLSKIEAEI